MCEGVDLYGYRDARHLGAHRRQGPSDLQPPVLRRLPQRTCVSEHLVADGRMRCGADLLGRVGHKGSRGAVLLLHEGLFGALRVLVL